MDHLASTNKGAFRVKDWWWSKAALLMGMIYLFAFWYHISFEKFVPLSLLSLTTITGFASMGYLFNDLFDIEKDRLAGKSNFLADKPAALVTLFFLISAAFVFAPWWFLPKNNFSYVLIGTQLLLFIVYSAPPVRLKERGLAGIITDALYAHGLPPVLAAYTFALAADHPFSNKAIAILFAWQTIAGFRNILIHQWEDAEADEKSGSKNLAATIGSSKFYDAIKWLILIEVALALAFFTALCLTNLWFVACSIIIVALTSTVLILYRNQTVSQFLSSLWRYFPNNVYEKWLPVIYLALLSSADVRFIILLILHLLLFNFDFYIQTSDKVYGAWKSVAFKGTLITVKIWLSYPVNYFIYYSFRVLGVDLKKKNISAAGYLKSRLNGKEAK